MLAAFGLAVGFANVYTHMETPDLARLRDGNNPHLGLATVVYSADGQELTRYYRENRTWISYTELSPYVVQALVATEDRRFYNHHGVDWQRLVSSLGKSALGNPQGGSTLPMQLARNFFPAVGRAPLLERKVYEIATALKIERRYRKHEILEMYLNTVPFGYHAFGIETAAQTYFNKTAAELDIAESATLVGMLKAITRYNPVRYPEQSRRRRNVVLRQMAKYRYLDPATAERLQQEPLALDFQFRTTATGPAPHFAEYVRTWLDEWASQKGFDPYTDGLRIHTTLDLRLQALAEDALAEQLRGLQAVAGYEWSRRSFSLLGDTPAPYERAEAAGRFKPFAYFQHAHAALIDQHIQRSQRYRQARAQGATPEATLQHLRADAAFVDSIAASLTRPEAGLVALDPATGHVLAWVGGRDFAQDQYDKVARARRQPGSTFKPFVYAAALEFGLSPLDRRIDEARTYQTAGSTQTWTPMNAGGEASGDTLTLREGLAYSKNTITAQLMDEMSPNWVARVAHQMGIESPLDEVPALALGTSDVTLLELVSAYGPLATHGQYHPPLFITRIEDRNGRVVAAFESETRKALAPATAYNVLDMMRGVVDEGTGVRIRTQFGIQADVAGKTGTTQNNADGWFILLHPHLTMGAWVGFNERRVTFRSNFWGQGGHNALYVVGDFFKRALAAGLYRPDVRFMPPPGYAPPTPPDSLPDPPTSGLFAAAFDSTASGDDAPAPTGVENVLRTAVARTWQADTTQAVASNTTRLPASDTTYKKPLLIPIDSTHRRTPASPRTRADNDLEQAMRRLLYPDAPARRDTSRANVPGGDPY